MEKKEFGSLYLNMKDKFIFLSLCLILLIPLFDLFHPGFPVTHDGQDHIARIANFYQNLREGIIIPRWAGNLNWGYGHPILMFLYPLPSYIASLFHFVGFSLIDSTKFTFALGMFISGITMYIWLSSFWGKASSFLGSLMYVFAPYRFVDLYVRGDIGENLAFVFIPLVLFFIHKLSIKLSLRYIIGGGFSLALLILSHNAISLMMVPVILVYAVYKVYFYAKEKMRFLFYFCLLIFLGFGISAFFWIPAFFEGKYTLRNIVTAGTYKDRFVSFKDLLYGPWSYGISGQFTVQLGILQWVFFLLALISLPYVWLKKQRKIPFVLILLITTVCSIFIMLPISAFLWARVILLQNFQFPWRFVAVTVFTTAILGAHCIELMSKKIQLLAVTLCVGIILFLSNGYWHAMAYKLLPESFFTGIYNSTTDTGESSPIWSIRFMEKPTASAISIISGSADIIGVKRAIIIHNYKINVISRQAQILENTLFFPGWRVFVDGKDTPIEFQNQMHRGLITFFVPNGKHEIVVKFTDTKTREISDAISLMSIILLAMIFGIRFLLNKI